MKTYNKGGENPKSMSRETVKDILSYPFAVAEERNISEETLEHFGVRMSVDRERGEDITAYYFPYYNQKGEISGFKKRDLTKDKYEKGHFTTIGKVGVQCKLFGQQQSEGIQRKHLKIVYTEGEWDVLSAYDSVIRANIGTKYEGMELFVVGLNCGCGNAEEATQNNRDFLESFDEIRLAFDNDCATDQEKIKGIKRGEEATQDVASVLMGNNLKVFKWNLRYDDLSEVMVEEGEVVLSKAISFDYTDFIAEKVVTGSQIGFDTFTAERPEGIYIDTFPELMNKIHGFRKRELVIVCAPSGVGKSTCTSEFAYQLGEQGQRVGMIFLEEETSETLQRMGSRHLKVKYNDFKKNPKAFASDDELREAYDWCADSNRYVFLDHFGSLRIDDLMKKIKTFVYQYKVDYVILDHLSMLVSGFASDNERRDLDNLMTELAAFVASNDVGIIAVSHMNRGVADGFKIPKGKENEPFWVPVRKEDLRGSAALEQLSWIVLGLEPQILPDKSRGKVRWNILKNRPWGYLGLGDEFEMDDKTGLLKVDSQIL